MKSLHIYGSFTFTDLNSDSDPDSDPIPIIDSQDFNLNPIPCCVKNYAYFHVAVWFVVRITGDICYVTTSKITWQVHFMLVEFKFILINLLLFFYQKHFDQSAYFQEILLKPSSGLGKHGICQKILKICFYTGNLPPTQQNV